MPGTKLLRVKGYLLSSLHKSENTINRLKKHIFTTFLRNKMLYKSRKWS